MPCAEKDRLVQHCNVAASVYSNLLGEFDKHIGVSSRDEYDQFICLHCDAKLEAEIARNELELHIAAHHC